MVPPIKNSYSLKKYNTFKSVANLTIFTLGPNPVDLRPNPVVLGPQKIKNNEMFMARAYWSLVLV